MKWFNVSVLVLLVILVGFQTCNYVNRRAEAKDKSRIDTLYISTHDHWHNVPFKVSEPYLVEVPGTPGATVTIPAMIDSLAIVKDYFTKRHYSDSIKTDSIEIKVGFSVWKNHPMDMKIAYRWLARTMVIERKNTVERQLAFAGIDLIGNKNYFSVMPSIYFDSKRAMFSAGYDPFNKVYKVGVYGKLKLWKRKVR